MKVNVCVDVYGFALQEKSLRIETADEHSEVIEIKLAITRDVVLPHRQLVLNPSDSTRSPRQPHAAAHPATRLLATALGRGASLAGISPSR